jgi:hypothetical protein
MNYENLDFWERRMVRQEYQRLQEGKCAHCKNPLDSKPTNEMLELEIDLSLFPKNFMDWPIHLHHDHNTGMTIGAVHCHCNAVLWQYHGK